MGERIEAELLTFRHFVQVTRLPVVPESIKKRRPPQPDVHCRLSDGEQVAFELVEICNPVNACFVGSVDHIYSLAMSAYLSLPPPCRKAFDHRFINVPLSFSFRPAASLSAIRNTLPSLLSDLVSAPEAGGYKGLSPAARAVVLSVRNVGRVENPGNVNFNIGTSFDPTVSLKAVAAKLSKNTSPIVPLNCWHTSGPTRGAMTRRIEMYFYELLKQLASVRLGESGCSSGMVLPWSSFRWAHLAKEQTDKTGSGADSEGDQRAPPPTHRALFFTLL